MSHSIDELDLNLLHVLLGLLAFALSLAFLVVLLSCLGSCCCSREEEESREKEPLPDDLLQEIQRLLDRHKAIESQLNEPPPIVLPSLGSVITSSAVETPVRMRSRTNSGVSRTHEEKLQKLKEELEEFRIDADEMRRLAAVNEGRRRTWGGLQDDAFEELPLPPQTTTDASVQTTGTLERMRAARSASKVETTV